MEDLLYLVQPPKNTSQVDLPNAEARMIYYLLGGNGGVSKMNKSHADVCWGDGICGHSV